MKPYIIINSAMSLDGKIATKERKQLKISCNKDFLRVDKMKSKVDAIMVGINTVISDNPSLTIKSEINKKKRIKYKNMENPIRIIIDSKAKININSDILTKGSGKRIIIVSELANNENVDLLKKNNHEVIICGNQLVDLKKAMELLYNKGIYTIMVEGGATLNYALIEQHLVDEIYTFIGNMVIGGTSSPTLVDGSGFTKDNIILTKLKSFEKIENGILLKWKVLK